MSRDELALEEFYSKRDFDLFLEEDIASESPQTGIIHTVASWLGFPAIKDFDKLIVQLEAEVKATNNKKKLQDILAKVSKEQDYAERASKETSNDRLKRAVAYLLLGGLFALQSVNAMNASIKASQARLAEAAKKLEKLEGTIEEKIKKG
jgi:hypothetical protein